MPVVNVNASRMPGLDLLRGLSALWVLLFHYLELAPAQFRPEGEFYFLRVGWNGVDLFFVLSGFLIAGILDRPGESVPGFMIRRFFRIYPAYILMVAFTLLLVKPELIGNTYLLVSHALLFNNLVGGFGGAINGVFWTLGAEFQFYLLAAFSLMLFRARQPWLLLIGLMLVGSLLYRQAIYSYVELAYQRFFLATQLPGMLGLFGMGVMAYWLRCRLADSIERYFYVLAACGGVLLYLFLSELRYYIGGYWDSNFAVVWGRFASGLVFGYLVLVFSCVPAPSARLIKSSGAVFLGEVSYGIYLVHLPVMELLAKYLPGLTLPHWSLYLGLVLGLVLALSAALYYLIELPFIRLGKRLSARFTGGTVAGATYAPGS